MKARTRRVTHLSSAGDDDDEGTLGCLLPLRLRRAMGIMILRPMSFKDERDFVDARSEAMKAGLGGFIVAIMAGKSDETSVCRGAL